MQHTHQQHPQQTTGANDARDVSANQTKVKRSTTVGLVNWPDRRSIAGRLKGAEVFKSR